MTHAATYRPGTAPEVLTFDAGWRAHECGRALDTNPYPEDSHYADEWDDGWYAASAARSTRYGG